jgi:ubiquinone/menaquinone biosynthesis C-methylase UbiE
MGKTDKVWRQFGEIDPYFGVLTQPRFRSAAAEGEARREFFESGEGHVRLLFEIIREHLDADFAPSRALDFGCGVGRLTLPLARRVGHVTGVDVSDAMLKEAQRNCEEFDVRNITLAKSVDDLETLDGEFDFLHSMIVFQHIPPGRGEKIFGEMLRRLTPGGVGALHFTYATEKPGWKHDLHRSLMSVPILRYLFNLKNGIAYDYPHFEMHTYNLSRLFFRLQQQGCDRILPRFSGQEEFKGVLLFFQKLRLPPI